MSCKEFDQIEEPYFNWRVLAGYVYLSICLFDFIVMPIIVHVNTLDTKEVVREFLFDMEDRKFALELIDRADTSRWQPLTLSGGGLFHLSFGAILTGAAVTRGFERTEMAKRNGRIEQSDK